MAEPQPMYLFTRGEGGIFAEVYFPKKVEYQARIFDSLRVGYQEQEVKTYLDENAEGLLIELAAYINLFDPYQYGTMERPEAPESSLERVKKRIAMYRSPFRGWSMYEVDGMFFNRRGRIYEERTQVIRLMFRFRSRYVRQARQANATDALRSILLLAIGERGLLATEEVWGEASRERYLAAHEPWEDQGKRRFVERYFTRVCQDVGKWIDDCALFVFGYLVRKFSQPQHVLDIAGIEEEIWVMSFFDMTLNVVRKSPQRTVIERRQV
ncbi:MAG: hypothetical protein Q8R39_01165 [bacterium]|nr:hypothetical protein [bacterium]MDZ4284222.1 hypothetical protein [Patescibacteria group bacterium]